MTDLQAQDFELTEAGRRQTILSVSAAPSRIWIGFVLDTSASVRNRGLQPVSTAVRLVELLPPGHPVCLLKFSEALELTRDWTMDRARLVDDIRSLRGGTRTNLWDSVGALLAADLERHYGRIVLFIMTDGEDNASRTYSERKVLELVRRSNLRINILHLPGKLGYGLESARRLADESGGAFIQVDGSADSEAVLRLFLASALNEYLIAFRSDSSEPGGKYRRIRVRTDRKGVTVRAKTGYYPLLPGTHQ